MNDVDRFWAKVDATGDCWEWTGARGGRRGEEYGHVGWSGKTTLAHRVAYELLIGPIPEGLQIDHLCRNHLCVNPTHLEPVTPRVNTLRGYGRTARQAAQTSCRRGHVGGFASLPNGRERYCVTCRRLTSRRPRLGIAAAVAREEAAA